MKEQIDEMYHKYLSEKLDLVFVKEKPKNEKTMQFQLIEKDNKYNFQDKKGNILSKEWFTYAWDFSEGFAMVRRGGLYNFIDESGNYISDQWFDGAWAFCQGYARIEYKGLYNYINTNGKLINSEWYDKVEDFSEGYGAVMKNGKWGYIDTNGKPLTPMKYYKARKFYHGQALVEKGTIVSEYDKYNYIDQSGKELLPRWISYEEWVFYLKHEQLNDNFEYIVTNNKQYLICSTVDLDKYKVNDIIGGYRCVRENEKFNIKYKPIKIYNSRYVLCLDKENVILFDRSLGKYTHLGDIRGINFIDNYIFDIRNRKTYFIYNGKMLDITDYYEQKLDGKKNIVINSDIDILSKDEFFIKYEEEVKKQSEKRKQEEEKRKQEESLKREGKTLETLQSKSQTEEKKREINRAEAIRSILLGIKKLEESERKSGSIERIRIDNLFVNTGGHREIKPIYLAMGLLKHIDLSMVSFKGVKMDGIDFRGCNIALFPQQVLGKSLRNCNFEGINIPPFMDFNGVDIRGCRFSEDDDPKTFDGYNTSFKNAIYDSSTTYNGVSFDQIYGKCMQERGNTK